MSAKAMLAVTSASLLLVWALLVLASPPHPSPAPDAARLPESTSLRSPVFGPSGIACHARDGRMFVVGDRGHLAELSRDGRELSRRRLRGDLEDVAILPDGRLLILDESTAEIFLYDYDREREQMRWSLDVEALLGVAHAPRGGNGFEGLAFVAGGAADGSGLLYLAHQHRPAMVVVAAFGPQRGARRLGSESVRARWSLERYRDAKAVTFVPALDRFLIVTDATDRLLVVRSDGTVTSELPLPGRQQEGACLDGDGTLWVTDDRARRLLVFPKAIEVLDDLIVEEP